MKTNCVLELQNSDLRDPATCTPAHPGSGTQEWTPIQVAGPRFGKAGVKYVEKKKPIHALILRSEFNISSSERQFSYTDRMDCNSSTNRVSFLVFSKFYVLANVETKTVLDLKEGDEGSVIGFTQHSGQNQQWEFIKLPDPASGKCSPHELQVWIDRATEAEKKAKEAEQDAIDALNMASKAEKHADDAKQKAVAAEEELKKADERAQAAERKQKEAEEKVAAAEEKVVEAGKKVDDLGWKVAALQKELETEHTSDEARDKNRQWLRDMLAYFEYRHGAVPDLVGEYPYLSGHEDCVDSWEWVKTKLVRTQAV